MSIKNITFFLFPYLLNEQMRVEWVKRQLLKIQRGASILDVGAGEMRYRKFCLHLKYKSQDFNEYTGKGDGIGLQTGSWDTSKIDIVSDIVKIPVKNSSFDNILCTEVLEHVPHPDMAIKEISRILRKRGRLILTAPFASQTHYSPYFFSTGFSINWYKKVLGENNFRVLKIEANGNFFDYLNQELCRFPVMIRKYSSLGWLSLLLYVLVVPLVFIIWIVSKISAKSEKQLCFGYHVVAVKV
ncbi:MAG: class I SAM-dependent methyltransferase [Candidatus Woesebacteria bacterium]|nr:MAG: class I SAM-dependent methyltransferase [Candidatus Woesebacteria bacterium]